MTIIVFLIDTSASMNQRTYIGPSFLDLAKGAVDTFLKFRARDPSARGADRYMLLTFEEPPRNIKAGWRESQAVFIQELKNLRATGVTTLGNALGNTLHLLNANRLQTGIDNFGAGRYPHWLEPAAIILITDGGGMIHPNGTVKQTIEITPSQLPGSELVAEPFRWDHRIFSLVLRLAAHPPKVRATAGLSLVPQDTSPVDAVCEATGGRSYSITTQKMINQCLESLVQKIQSGVVVSFEKYGPDPPPVRIPADDGKAMPLENGFIHHAPKHGTQANHATAGNIPRVADVVSLTAPMEIDSQSRPSSPSPPPADPAWVKTRRMIYVARGLGSRWYNTSHWTIPEAFWPDPSMTVLPPRSSHPLIRFKCDPQDVVFPQDLPFDKYELEPSPLTQFILERKQPNVCWYCYVVNSNGKPSDLGAPFGYLKASSAMNSVNLVVLPYNFPVLLPLLDEVRAIKGKATSQWRSKFESYLKGVPPYYITALKAAFQKINLIHLLADFPEKYLSVSVQAHLGKVKLRAREELERLNQSVGQSMIMQEGVKIIPRSPVSALLSSKKLLNYGIKQTKVDTNDFVGFRIHTVTGGVGSVSKSSSLGQMSFRNPFDIEREKLLAQIAKMRVNFKQSLVNGPAPQLGGTKPGMKYRLQDVEELHQLPIGLMGNYQEYLRLMTPPLRDIDATPVRLHAFGNPFKVDKRMLVDEADIDTLVGSAVAAAGSGHGSPRPHSKRSGSAGSSENMGVGRPQTPSPHTQQGRKRRPGPLPPDLRYARKRRRRAEGLPYETDDDRSSISGVSSPAPSDISIESDGEERNEEPGRTTPVTPEVICIDGPEASTSALIIDSGRDDDHGEHEVANVPSIVEDDQMPSVSQVTESFETTRGKEDGSKIRRPAVRGENGSDSCTKKKMPTKIKFAANDWMCIKTEISALIRKPSQDYRVLFEKIDGLPKAVGLDLYSWALSEAERFRRTHLCERLRMRLSESTSVAVQKPSKPKR